MNTLSNTDMLNLVFEQRNKTYGAYTIRRDYPEHIKRAFLIVFASSIMLFGMSFGFQKSVIIPKPPIVDSAIVFPPFTFPPEETKPDKIYTTSKKIGHSLPTEIAPDPVTPPPADIDTTSGSETGTTIGTDDGYGAGIDSTENTGISKSGSEQNKPFSFPELDALPEFVGSLPDFLRDNIPYDPGDGEGKVKIRFVVEKDGTVSGVEVATASGWKLNEAALSVVKKTSGMWKPGTIGGRAVRVAFLIPIEFQLQDY